MGYLFRRSTNSVHKYSQNPLPCAKQCLCEVPYPGMLPLDPRDAIGWREVGTHGTFCHHWVAAEGSVVVAIVVAMAVEANVSGCNVTNPHTSVSMLKWATVRDSYNIHSIDRSGSHGDDKDKGDLTMLGLFFRHGCSTLARRFLFNQWRRFSFLKLKSNKEACH